MLWEDDTILPTMGAWYDDRGVHNSVQRMIREFRPHMRVTRLFSGKYAVASPIHVVHRIPGTGLGVMFEEWFPQLFVPQASEPDIRWIKQMYADKLRDYTKRGLAKLRREHEAHIRGLEESAEWFAEESYGAVRDYWGRYNMANVQPVNKYDRVKQLQDRLGREIR